MTNDKSGLLSLPRLQRKKLETLIKEGGKHFTDFNGLHYVLCDKGIAHIDERGRVAWQR